MYREQHVSMCAGWREAFLQEGNYCEKQWESHNFSMANLHMGYQQFLLGECICLKVTSNGHGIVIDIPSSDGLKYSLFR